MIYKKIENCKWVVWSEGTPKLPVFCYRHASLHFWGRILLFDYEKRHSEFHSKEIIEWLKQNEKLRK